MTREDLEMAIAALKVEPCEDAIKRQSVLNTLDTMDKALDENRTIEAYKELLKECYKALPPVTPARKKGKWILHPDHDAMECSECGHAFDEFMEGNYCPHCGADMRVNPVFEIFMGMIKNGHYGEEASEKKTYVDCQQCKNFNNPDYTKCQECEKPIKIQCNECKYYEGVHNVPGHAPCSYWNSGGVLWNWFCSQGKKVEDKNDQSD